VSCNKELRHTRLFYLHETCEIEKLYGKWYTDLIAPEGYEFTGEFRVGRKKECYLDRFTLGLCGPIAQDDYDVRGGTSKRLILRPIAKKTDLTTDPSVDWYKDYTPVPPPPPTAEDIKEKFGRELLDTFYGRPDVIQDVPGFEFTGRLQSVPPGEWYLNTAGQAKQSGTYGTVGLYLTLTKVAGPRIITYTLTSREDLDGGEARYCPDDMGGMMTDTSDSSFVYTRSEVS
jgi:hypothetical protein